MITPAKTWLRTYVKPVIVRSPRLYGFSRKCLAAYREFRHPGRTREHLLLEFAQQQASANAERTFLLKEITQYQQAVEQQQADITRLAEMAATEAPPRPTTSIAVAEVPRTGN